MARKGDMASGGMEEKTKRGDYGSGRLYKRAGGRSYPANYKGKGTFYLAYRDMDGKRVTVRLMKDGKPVATLAEAQAEQRRLRMPYLAREEAEKLKYAQSIVREAEAQAAEAEAQAEEAMTIADAWGKWDGLAQLEITPGLKRHYSQWWRDFAAFCQAGGQMEKGLYLREMTAEMARGYIDGLKARGLSSGTVNKNIVFLRSFFEVLKAPARLAVNPFAELKKMRAVTNTRRVLTVEEVRALVEKADGEMRTLFLVGACTGLRCGDCATLKWSEVDLVRGIIRRKPNKTLHSSGAAVVVAIPRGLAEELAAIPEPHSGFVMPGLAKSYACGSLPHMISRHFAKCGIATSHTDGKGRSVIETGFHSLRHTWVSLQAMRGTPQAVIQASVGHSNPVMTEHYTHVSEEAARRAVLELPVFHEEEAAPEELAALRRQVAALADKAGAAALRRMIEAAEQ